MKNDIRVLQSNLVESFFYIEKNTNIQIYSDNHRSRKSERNSIDYEPSTADDAADFTDLLYDELELRSLDLTGSLNEMRLRLQESLVHEAKMRLLLNQVQHCEGVGIALFLVMQAVPCILHCDQDYYYGDF
jgi:hypothetical protein